MDSVSAKFYKTLARFLKQNKGMEYINGFLMSKMKRKLHTSKNMEKQMS